MEQFRNEMMKAVHAREVALEAREKAASEKEARLAKQEQEGKASLQRDIYELKQVAGTIHKLDEQGRSIDEKRIATDAFAVSLEDREASLKSRETASEHRELILKEKEQKWRSMTSVVTNQVASLASRPKGSCQLYGQLTLTRVILYLNMTLDWELVVLHTIPSMLGKFLVHAGR